MKSYSLSLHQEGDLYRRGHNVRLGISISKSGNVNVLESHRNIILVDIPAREAYEKIFSAAVEEFNDRQKNYDRKIRNYYDKIHQDPQKHNVYEMIVQVGSIEDGFPDRAATLLMNYAVSFESRNPNLRVIGAYIHFDESTPHLHLDYIPVAECSRGMRLQNSLTGALKEQGFKSRSSKNTAQMQWEKSERQFIRQMCKNMNIPLRDEGKGRKKHFSVPEYKAMKEDLKAMELELANKQKEIDKLDAELQQLHAVLEHGKKLADLLSFDTYMQAVYDRAPAAMKELLDEGFYVDKHYQYWQDNFQSRQEEITSQIEDIESKMTYDNHMREEDICL